MEKIYARQVNRETDLKNGFTVALPAGWDCDAFAGATVLQDPSHEILTRATGPVLVIGNLSDIRLAAYLYKLFMIRTDLYYPGEGGYELRTLADPFGTGYNILHLGYSDETGRNEGLYKLLSLLGDVVPNLFYVKATNLLCNPAYPPRIKASALPDDPGVYNSTHSSFWWYTGYLYYQTGDEEYLAIYRKGLEVLLPYAKEHPDLGNNAHFYSFRHSTIWRLMELTGIFPEDLREDIHAMYFHWLPSIQGAPYILHSIHPEVPTHNHTMVCALAVQTVCDYFLLYMDLPELREYRRLGAAAFESFDNGGWKPCCDDSSYSLNFSLSLVCIHSAYDDEHRFFKNSGQATARYIKAMCGQNGFYPSVGDASCPAPGFSCKILGYFLQDPELVWMAEQNGIANTTCPDPFYYNTAYTAGIAPKKPNLTSMIQRIPMDSCIYNEWDTAPDVAKRQLVSRPDAPIEDCFDKLALRSSYEIDGDYLLVDGLGNTSIHAYGDTLGILDYSGGGVSWFCEECDYEPSAESYNVVNILQNGLSKEIPSFGILEEVREDQANRTAYARFKLVNHNGCDLIREMTLSSRKLDVKDTVIAREEGDYLISCLFRTPASAEKNDNGVLLRSLDGEGNPHHLQMVFSTEAAGTVELHTEPVRWIATPIAELEDDFEAPVFTDSAFFSRRKRLWEKRYGNNTCAITIVKNRSNAHLRVGESMSLYASFTVDGELCENKPQASCVRSAADAQNAIPFVPTIVQSVGDCLLCGNDEGQVALIGKDGRQHAFFTASGRIDSMAYDAETGYLFVGCAGYLLEAYTHAGERLWQYVLQRRDSEFPSWQLQLPTATALACYTENGNRYIAVACGDNSVMVVDYEGDLVSKTPIYATIPHQVFVAKQGDIARVFTSGKYSHIGKFTVSRTDGTLENTEDLGPWLCAVLCRDYEPDTQTVIAGLKYGISLKCFTIGEDGKGKPLFARAVGAGVAGVGICTDGFVAASSDGAIVFFDRAGNYVHHQYLSCGIVEFGRAGSRAEDRFAALLADGQVALIEKKTIKEKVCACDRCAFGDVAYAVKENTFALI